jgi:Dolichyl-phosphate-mannose-protein mannosyltransferase
LTSDDTQARDLRPLPVLAIHVVVFTALLWWSWRRWCDPLVDFGRELYVPWRINAGQVLYRDLASLFGPLSPYVNALWFRTFSTSLLTLALCNAVIFAATVAGIYHLVRASTDRVTATAASLTTLLLFGFTQYIDVGNYNFITPYSHEATHGIALAVACLVSLQFAAAARSRRWCAVAGTCFGLALLTKPEIGLALAAGVFAGWLASYAVGGRDRTELAAGVPLFVTMAFIPLLLFFLYFATQMDSTAALRATAGAWVPLFGTGIASNAFYRWSMGLDAPIAHAGQMLLTFAVFVALIGAVIFVSWTSTEGLLPSRGKRVVRIGLLGAAILLLRHATFPRALPLIAVTALVAVCALLIRDRKDRARATRLVPLIMWSAFAVVLLAKMGLNARVVHYGFYLALPAMVACVVLVSWVIPYVLAQWKTEAVARSARQLALWMLAAAIAPYLAISHGWYRTRTLPVGSGADRFMASTRGGQGRVALDALAMLEGQPVPTSTLAVLPEGVMLNYLMRLESPLRVINLMPPELLAFGEEDVLRSLAARPPDFVVLLRRNTMEYGYPLFGSDPRYGLRTMSWINERYEPLGGVNQNPAAVIRLLTPKKK